MLIDEALLAQVSRIAWDAADATLQVYQGHIRYKIKADGSPVSNADLLAHHIIDKGLRKLSSCVPIISEEQANLEWVAPENNTLFWLVDPLDGTKEFLQKSNEFTVNIALIKNEVPILGIVVAPALGVLYAGLVGKGAFKFTPAGCKQRIFSEIPKYSEIHALCSRSHGQVEAIEGRFGKSRIKRITCVGSSLKFCKIAEGGAHFYPRLGRTMEWDTAAGHAVLIAAGGVVEQLSGTCLRYGKQGFENPYFLAKSHPFLLG